MICNFCFISDLDIGQFKVTIDSLVMSNLCVKYELQKYLHYKVMTIKQIFVTHLLVTLICLFDVNSRS